ncbi:proteasome ATPase [Catellatospora paridis]|uniref:proteasome ATPase n=1 Tax=Catellatospora paridis TaxID=1617086 RepID=UPI0012D422F3|nr:proteasome ATPase [Catellatospora paridis]
MTDSDGHERVDGVVEDLSTQVARLQEELALVRRKLSESPGFIRLTETNERLVATLKEARAQIVSLKEEVDRLGEPPSGYGIFLARNDDGSIDVFTGGRVLRVALGVQIDELRSGQTVLLNDALNVVDALAFERTGEVVTLKEILDGGDRALVVSHADEERVVQLADKLIGVPLRSGDSLMIEPRSAYAYERIPKSEVENLVLEEAPDVGYSDIGGLVHQIEQIRNAVELPFLHAELFREHHLRPPKGVLLYGPPGCGKTLIAKAVANSLAKKIALQRGEEKKTSYFLNIKGPELLNKYVGETERHIRLIFQRAREKASEGTPVIVFFDEMDSIFRTRGSGVSSDVENTIVPQLLSEIDGVEGLENVIIIGASNREDMIDPAILRPGRLDVKIKIERPDAEEAKHIFSKYITSRLPLHADDVAAHHGDDERARQNMVERTVEYLYAKDALNKFVEVTFESGNKQDIYFSHFMSGAIIRNVVDRAKLLSVLRFLAGDAKGLRVGDLIQAAREEMRSVEDLTSTTNQDDWARIAGAQGERITFVRTVKESGGTDSGKALDISRSNYG